MPASAVDITCGAGKQSIHYPHACNLARGEWDGRGPVPDTAKIAYRVDEACAALGCKKSFLYELLAAGELEARKLGAKTLVSADSVRAYYDRLPLADVKAPYLMRLRALREQNATSK